MALSVRSVQNTDDLQEIVDQINITNNEMTQNFNALVTLLNQKEKEIASLKTQVNSLNNKLGEFSVYMKKPNTIKKFKAKNYKLGESALATIDSSTLFKDETGALSWSDDNGVVTVLVP